MGMSRGGTRVESDQRAPKEAADPLECGDWLAPPVITDVRNSCPGGLEPLQTSRDKGAPQTSNYRVADTLLPCSAFCPNRKRYNTLSTWRKFPCEHSKRVAYHLPPPTAAYRPAVLATPRLQAQKLTDHFVLKLKVRWIEPRVEDWTCCEGWRTFAAVEDCLAQSAGLI
jgi:hypothetical protein